MIAHELARLATCNDSCNVWVGSLISDAIVDIAHKDFIIIVLE
jgi:hypothetical protein